MKPIKITLLSIFLTSLMTCTTKEVAVETVFGKDLDSQLRTLLFDNGGVDEFILPDSDDLGRIPNDPLNPITAEKIALGRTIFFDEQYGVESKTKEGFKKYSCASCHRPDKAFYSGMIQGIGEGGFMTPNGIVIDGEIPESLRDVQPVRTPTAMNAAFIPSNQVLWDASMGSNDTTTHVENALGYQGLEIQGMKGFNVHRLGLDKTYILMAGHDELFAEAFPDEIDPVNDINAGLALAAYERTLITNETPFQNWLRGDDDAMSEEEKIGVMTFIKQGCMDCHLPPSFGGKMTRPIFHNTIDTTKVLNFIKTPQLYSVVQDSCFGHGSYPRNIDTLLHLKSPNHIEEIRAFLEAINDDNTERYFK